MGKLVGGLIGFVTFGFIGVVIGVLIGHFFDQGRQNIKERFNPERRAEVEKAFFKAVFPIMGHIAKSDGRISEEEIQGTEQLINKMGLDGGARQKAISLFKEGAVTEFSLESALDEFTLHCGDFRDLKQILLVYLITIAYADGQLHSAEEEILTKVADRLGYSRFAFNQLMGMIKAQAYFYHGRQGQQSWHGGHSGQPKATPEDELKLAYEALGVESSVSDAELKKAYRKLMSEFHPDKLAGKGVPEDMVKLATERSQEIQSAYELLKKHRKS